MSKRSDIDTVLSPEKIGQQLIVGIDSTITNPEYNPFRDGISPSTGMMFLAVAIVFFIFSKKGSIIETFFFKFKNGNGDDEEEGGDDMGKKLGFLEKLLSNNNRNGNISSSCDHLGSCLHIEKIMADLEEMKRDLYSKNVEYRRERFENECEISYHRLVSLMEVKFKYVRDSLLEHFNIEFTNSLKAKGWVPSELAYTSKATAYRNLYMLAVNDNVNEAIDAIFMDDLPSFPSSSLPIDIHTTMMDSFKSDALFKSEMVLNSTRAYVARWWCFDHYSFEEYTAKFAMDDNNNLLLAEKCVMQVYKIYESYAKEMESILYQLYEKFNDLEPNRSKEMWYLTIRTKIRECVN
jgi:hypothetical protein